MLILSVQCQMVIFNQKFHITYLADGMCYTLAHFNYTLIPCYPKGKMDKNPHFGVVYRPIDMQLSELIKVQRGSQPPEKCSAF